MSPTGSIRGTSVTPASTTHDRAAMADCAAAIGRSASRRHPTRATRRVVVLGAVQEKAGDSRLEMAEDLDAQVEAFRTRPLDAGPYTFVAADALTMKVRQDGRLVNAAVLGRHGCQR